jgi:undecaprenyl-diphosphatase
MRVRHAVVLGVVQGLTEFLPVSSSAHLALVRRLCGWRDAPRAFDVALHTGTTAALVLVEGEQYLTPIAALIRDGAGHRSTWSSYRPSSRFALKLAVATLPAITAGAVCHAQLERWTSRPTFLMWTLLAGSLPLLLARERARAGMCGSIAGPRRSLHGTGSTASVEDVSLPVLLGMGFAQAVALVPGISRSGSTIALAMACGVDRRTAARLSFLLATPVTLAAAARSLPALRTHWREAGAAQLLAGAIASFLSGFAGLAVMSLTMNRWGLRPFAVYRVLLAAYIRWAAGRRD